MSDALVSFLIGITPLYVLAALAGVLTVTRHPSQGDTAAERSLVGLFLLGVAAQCVHCTEEFVTQLYDRLPTFLGLTPWSPDVFIGFNLVWIAVWVAAAVGLTKGLRIALFPIWFFALGMVVNLVAHPLLAVGVGGYFPGLITSPVVGVLGVLVLHRLLQFTTPQHGQALGG